jgi:outer membrane protein OmpA-like peptidoglycan-associated protein
VAVPVSTAAVSVPFAGDSAALSPAAQTALKQLAGRRGTAVVAVTGYGDAASSEAADQAAALPLAWSRAQAIARALQSAGVPTAMLRLTAEAGGRGGVAALTD